MQKLSMRKLSILSLVLMGASAVTAAIIPSKSDKSVKFVNGSLTENSGPGGGQISSVTCEVDTIGGGLAITAPCNISESNTTTLGDSDATVSSAAGGAGQGAGMGNTSDAS